MMRRFYIGLTAILLGVGCLLILERIVCKPVFANSCDHAIELLDEVNSAQSVQISPRYFIYNPSLHHQAFASNTKVVLYFYAPWCTTCVSLDQEIAKDPTIIPEDVLVLQIPFDKPSELKTKYGVMFPHTFVWIGNSGEVLNQWIGGEPELLRENTR
ncbi:hypothetical protein HY469_01565 [Candidatus Roizmanbacteria bacterium]|nr:hypothetical protein [Candidatus Roizmanbacteria bacterium]